MFYSREVIDDVCMGNDIVDVIGQYVQLKKNGSSYTGLCPFHHEKSPSFHVSRDRQLYHCFGCNAGGNVIGFIERYQNLSFPDAVKTLAERIHYNLPEETYSPDYAYKAELRKKLYEVHKVAARFFYEQLNSAEGAHAMRYLEERKVLKSTRIKFGLGYSPISRHALYDHLKSAGYSDEVIVKSGLVKRWDDGSFRDKFYNRVMYPIIDVRGNIIAFGGRALSDVGAKYLNSPETEIFKKDNNLYNLNLARMARMRELILVEGYMDAISIYQAGFCNVVASLGTAFNAHHAKLFKAYADSVILLFDSDSAGVNAVLKAMPYLNDAGINVKVAQVTEAKDPDEYIKKFGASEFGKLLAASRNRYTFLIDYAATKYDLSVNEGRIGYTNEVAGILAQIDNAIEADVYIRETAESTGVSESAIRNVIASLKGQAKPQEMPRTRVVSKTEVSKKGVDEARKSLICAMVNYPAICTSLSKVLAPEEFVDDFYITIVQAVYELAGKNRPVTEGSLVGCFEDADKQARAAQLFLMQTVYSGDKELHKAVSDQLNVVKLSYIDDKIAKATNPLVIKELFEEKRKLDKLDLSLG